MLDMHTLEEQQELQRKLKDYMLLVVDDVQSRLHRIRDQWKVMQKQNKHKKILNALLKKENLF